MRMFGYPLETIYLFTLIICGSLTFLYLLISDVVHGVFESIGVHVLNPTLVLSFLTFVSAGGYLLEKLTSVQSWLIVLISSAISLVLVTLLNVFVLIPIASAEESLNYSESDLKGRMGKVIISIPENGLGEVLIEGVSGRIAKPAISIDQSSIPQDTEILIVDMKNGVAHVMPHERLELPL
ncbi:NfeD family protein [Fictibacillus gelatini]|uniref:NfeD family protein n=1 Tax=Fictibacillus gelatini TaxID=225985 RepID=UPI00047D91F3|nr:NfeD family protein [Fictibacillus gelatini]